MKACLVGKSGESGVFGTKDNNTYFGVDALGKYTTGSGNTAIGQYAMKENTTGNFNTAIGQCTLFKNTRGANNTAIGNSALRECITGSYNTAIGYSALSKSTTGNGNTAIGQYSLGENTIGSSNTSIGRNALEYNTTGSSNTSIGYYALSKNTTGHNNTVIGYEAMKESSTGDNNTVIGYEAMTENTTGRNNTTLGYMAGTLTTGVSSATKESIYIGYNAKLGNANAANEIVIGADTTGGGSNTITLGNNAITKLRCQVTTITALSDKRLKEEIEPADLNKCLESVKKLPVTRYRYKDFTGTHVDKNVTGFMADDVEKVFPKAVSKTDQYFPVLDEKGNQVYEEVDGVKVAKTFLMEDVKDITMTEALPTLWGAVQALIKEVDTLKDIINNSV